ncbi:tetratricopeptide repeat protein [Coprobacter tertius]|uniref:Tetratricopeptide repeat protein n=1 Tax=Coprobacter tertius TaxID=2944915 RepID=A0ABT1MHK9_9BACT|nr:tetratricopeptide repeat protein [Coprobacter tertius]MCP9612100.1 tetratricopeptide repeat protein [Coprobacter tertius]
MRKIFLTAACCLFASASFAQMKMVNRAFSEAKMENPDFNAARNAIKEAMENPETKEVAKTWYVGGFVENKAFENDQKKMMINQEVKENDMYNALYNTYKYFRVAAKYDTVPNEKGKVKPKYLRDIKTILKNNQAFFMNAGAYYYNQKDYNKAGEMWQTYLDIPDIDFMKSMDIKKDTTYTQIKYNRAIAAVIEGQGKDDKAVHEVAIKTLEGLKDSKYNEMDVYKFLTYEYETMKDTTSLVKTLEEAVTKFGKDANKDDYQFLLKLINYYIYSDQAQRAIAYLDKALETDPQNAEYWKVKGSLYSELKDDDKAIECMKKAIEINPDYVDAIGELGRLYYNKAIEMTSEISTIKEDKAYIQARNEKVVPYYKLAMPLLEKAHKMKPDESMYKIALRGIYYNLEDEANLKRIESEM